MTMSSPGPLPSSAMNCLMRSLYLPSLQQVLDAAQVAEAFFADVADEENVAGRCEIPAAVHRADHREQHGQRSRVVADARRGEPRALALDADVRAFRKDGVEMRGDGDERTAGGPSAPHAHDVAFGVALDVGQTVLPQHLQKCRAAFVFLERRRGNFGERDDVGNHAVVEVFDRLQRCLNPRVRGQPPDAGGRPFRRGLRQRNQGDDEEKYCPQQNPSASVAQKRDVLLGAARQAAERDPRRAVGFEDRIERQRDGAEQILFHLLIARDESSRPSV